LGKTVPEQLAVIERIKEMHTSGTKYLQIAKRLNEEGANQCLSLNKKFTYSMQKLSTDVGMVTSPTDRKTIDQRIVSHHKPGPILEILPASNTKLF